MTGLASKWATDDSLVEEAKKQDEIKNTPVEQKTTSIESKWSKPVTVGKKQTLVSKWADSPAEETSKPPVAKESHHQEHSTHKPSRSKEPNRSKETNRPKEPKSYRDHSKENQHADSGAHTRSGRSHGRTKSRDVQYSAPEIPVQERGPMTNAADAFAARIGVPSKPVNRVVEEHVEEGDGFVTTDEEDEEEENEEELEEVPVLSAAQLKSANVLASRLGGISLKENTISKKNTPGRQTPTTKNKPDTRGDSRDKNRKDERGTKSKYETPRQKKERDQRTSQNEERRRAQLNKEAEEKKAEQEMLKMLDKLDAKEIDWVDFE
ncbi:predicted protein [Scheffersomyces stipitis CBS 6054]|uniref:Uncharacterized protein n=1 Tax=Scheffersomyces stipitis (strain ATCC 58785 / CBS 6054 / NBRC 10063 / NRRL Y-11545) TaxID=322104 RepID=A3LXY0_PICST|nr:predicted protein [Scheffersomyces stipitis CBS 6054]ABN67540.2 predicted protein [Scheffersomyces stipitis CBS 6054]